MDTLLSMKNPPITDPHRETRRLVLSFTKKGYGPREIANLLDISTQRVYQHLRALRESGDLKEAS